MAESLSQDEMCLEKRSSGVQTATEKQDPNDADSGVDEESPRDLHGVKVSSHIHKRNACSSREHDSYSSVASGCNSNFVHNTPLQFGHNNCRTNSGPHASVLLLKTDRERLPMFNLIL